MLNVDRRDAVDVDLALDRRRRLVRMNRGRMAAVDHVVPVQADIDDVGSARRPERIRCRSRFDRVMAAADDRVVTVAAGDRVVPGAGDKQVVAMEDLKKIGGASAHQRVGGVGPGRNDPMPCHRRPAGVMRSRDLKPCRDPDRASARRL